MTRRLLLSYLTIAVIVLVVLEVPLARFYQQRETERLTVGRRARRERAGEPLRRRPRARDAARPRHRRRRTPPAPACASWSSTRRGISLVDTAGTPGATSRRVPRSRRRCAATAPRASGIRTRSTPTCSTWPCRSPRAGTCSAPSASPSTPREVDAAVHRFWLGLPAVAAVVLTAIAGIGWAIARSVTRPLRHLHAAAARFATGDLTAIDPDPDAPPEIAALGATMNTMAQRLDQLLGRAAGVRGRRLAPASHAAHRPAGCASRTCRATRPRGERRRPRRRDRRDRQAGRPRRRPAQARPSRSRPPRPSRSTSCRLARDRVDTWSAIADAAGVALDFARAGRRRRRQRRPQRSRADPRQPHRQRDHRVAVGHPRRRDRRPAASGDHRLDRRRRGSRSQRRAQGARARPVLAARPCSKPGTGLGLPIAQALAEASGGSLRLDDRDGGGLAVTVTLPAASVVGGG